MDIFFNVAPTNTKGTNDLAANFLHTHTHTFELHNFTVCVCWLAENLEIDALSWPSQLIMLYAVARSRLSTIYKKPASILP
jgi:hypothetical protein